MTAGRPKTPCSTRRDSSSTSDGNPPEPTGSATPGRMAATPATSQVEGRTDCAANSRTARASKTGEIRTEIVVRTLECSPGRVNDERRETAEHHERLHPPGVAPRGCTEPPGNLGYLNVGHGLRPPSPSSCFALRSIVRKAGRIISHGTFLHRGVPRRLCHHETAHHYG